MKLSAINRVVARITLRLLIDGFSLWKQECVRHETLINKFLKIYIR